MTGIGRICATASLKSFHLLIEDGVTISQVLVSGTSVPSVLIGITGSRSAQIIDYHFLKLALVT